MSTEPFTPVPNWVIDECQLTNAEMAFYMRLARFRINKRGHPHRGKAFPTRHQLEKATGLSTRRVNELLKALTEKGAIERAEEETRYRVDFVVRELADEVLDLAGEPLGAADQALATPLSRQEEDQEEDQAASANAPASQKPRAKRQEPPRADQIMEKLLSDGTLRQWGHEFAALDGRNGRPSLSETIYDAMEWQHERKSRWKTDQKRFLKRWVRTTAARFWGAYRYDQRADGGGRPAHVIDDNPVRPGVNFNEVEDA